MYKNKGLEVLRLGIDSHQERIVYLNADCHVVQSEGFTSHSRVCVDTGIESIIASVNITHNGLVTSDQAAFSEAAWRALGLKGGERVMIKHAKPVNSMSHVRSKLYGGKLDYPACLEIVSDIQSGQYSDIQLSSFVSACTADRLSNEETLALTRSMIDVGERISWDQPLVMDKHCVGGLPGNRTTPIVVAIVAACGLIMPKTSSRAITSPAGTADTMEVLTNVELTQEKMQQVVAQEGACLAWGGSVSLSPADDIIIRIERALNLDSEGQLVASVLSKKVAAGSTHVLIDIPVGPTAKVRSFEQARKLEDKLVKTGKALGLEVLVHRSDGSQPVGRGIGPALEARDILSVLKNHSSAPVDLRDRAVYLAGLMLEMAGVVDSGAGVLKAQEVLDSGEAYQKFIAICETQGGLKEIPKSSHQVDHLASCSGIVTHFNNRCLAQLARLAGAPNSKVAGVELLVRLGDRVEKGQPLFRIHANAKGEMEYALDFLAQHSDCCQVSGETV
ncbi:thymidine phosphorylase family protein [Litoribrevibacter albus]|uniref:Putative thymidine phosphorylase n=1 Tax=Litoribrevibacter albus TaxID=1473156 RepID=A0AA37S9Y7_9GAMM|nr:thymidine phosphorylase family protein [Litoribrevibacter albus]GLQ31040.1 putative thymidine phosphorylase [Litoribrevibacter albus]